MWLLLWDASALVKRYFHETGSDTVDALFGLANPQQMVGATWGYAETFAILVRRRNDGKLSPQSFTMAVSALQREIITDSTLELLAIEDDLVMAALTYISRHNLNSADAALLATFLNYSESLSLGTACVVVTADKRLQRAANAEGFAVINPEQLAAADVANFLNSL